MAEQRQEADKAVQELQIREEAEANRDVGADGDGGGGHR